MENKLENNKIEDDDSWGIQPYIDYNSNYEINESSNISSQKTDQIEILHYEIDIHVEKED